jgi:FkbM family methyltransferase
MFKKMLSFLPLFLQFELRRWLYASQIRTDRFKTSEPEYAMLNQFVQPGDWVIDIGANVGHYTKRLSDLVGANGRVFAFEPIPETFALLALNVQHVTFSNVTLFNAAVSDETKIVRMSIPKFSSGLSNFYEAHISETEIGNHSIFTLPLGPIHFSKPIRLIKIDAEGHEKQVLSGLKDLMDRFHPTLILETDNETVIQSLKSEGYYARRLPGSPNVVFTFGQKESI